MFKKHHILAIVSFLLIPAVAVLAEMLINLINPEIAAGDPNYERNYQLLSLAQSFSMLAALLVIMGLWLLTCFYLLRSKQQPHAWLFLAVLGRFGFIVLAMLSDKAPAAGDLYQRFVGKLKIYLRVAYQAMVLKRGVMVMYESATTGAATAQIIAKSRHTPF